MIIIVNNNQEGMKLRIPVWIAEIPNGVLMERLMLSVEDGFSTEQVHYLICDNTLEIFMPPHSAAVLRRK